MGESMVLYPIGYVRTQVPDEEVKYRRATMVSEIIVHTAWIDGLDGIEDYSHLIVLFWMHRVNPQEIRLKVYPRGRADLPQVGIFATRSRNRPNPIGLAVVELLERRNSVLVVRGLDAYNGSPVLDIKPYDYYDVKMDIRVPAWWHEITGWNTPSEKHRGR